MDVARWLRGRVVVFTGAGISVASGIQPFRGSGGLYENVNPYDLATPEAFARDPLFVWQWYASRIRSGQSAEPNAAHFALAQLGSIAAKLTLISSNVDNLHERAGSSVYKLHGDIWKTRCIGCGSKAPVDESVLELIESGTVPSCACSARLRPDVVWFGEFPSAPAIEAAQRDIPEAHLYLEVGVSGSVTYGFDEFALACGVRVVRINPDAIDESGATVIREPAEVALPKLLEGVRLR